MGTCCTIYTLSQPSHHLSCPRYTPAPDCEKEETFISHSLSSSSETVSAFLCLCFSISGIVAQSKQNTDYITLADNWLINASVRWTENSIFFIFFLNCLCLCLYTLHCSLFVSPLTVSFLLSSSYSYLHNAHVYVLTNQFAALSNHESGCCSGCVKCWGQQRKAICLLHLRAKLCCLRTLQVTWQRKSNSLYN